MTGEADGRSARAGRGLDLLNLLVAGSQTGFGAFVSVHLSAKGWTQAHIGEALSVGTAVAVVGQLPAGWLVDHARSKRAVLAVGAAAVAASAVLLAVSASPASVLVVEVLHGFASCLIGPALAALSLVLAGGAGFGQRLGRNARFASVGSAGAALVLGWLGTVLPGEYVFAAAAAMMGAGLLAIPLMPGGTPATAAAPVRQPPFARFRALGDRRLLGFAACVALFQFANAAMLPLVAGELTRVAGMSASLVIAASIVGPQVIVALISPWVGRTADRIGRRPLLVGGFAAVPVRGVLLALGAEHPVLVALVQLLDGISAAALGVLLPLVAADLAGGRDGFTLRMAFIGLAGGVGATLSTTIAGRVAGASGVPAALLLLAAVGAAAVLGTALSRETAPRGLARAGQAA